MFHVRGPVTGNERSPMATNRDRGTKRISVSADDLSRRLESMSATRCSDDDRYGAARSWSPEDQRRNLEVDSIDSTQPVQLHQGWRYVVWPPEIEDRSCHHIDDRQGMVKDSRWCIRRALLFFTNPPPAVAKAHRMGPRGCWKSLDWLKSCCCEISRSMPRRLRSAFISIDFLKLANLNCSDADWCL